MQEKILVINHLKLKIIMEVEIIKGHCRTNLDDYSMTVTEFFRVPNIGERVACRKKGYETTLRVCQITHDCKNGKPYIIVELHN